MKKILLILLTMIMVVQTNAQSILGLEDLFGFGQMPQTRTESRRTGAVDLTYDLDAQYYFDNREFDRSDNKYTSSMTIHALDVTPFFGVKVEQGQNVTHRLMAGLDVMHDMGTSTALKNTQFDLQCFYDATVRTRRGAFCATAGVYPRSFVSGEYSEAFISDSLKFYDRSMEGVLLQYGSDRFFAELGLDWMGKFGYEVKERFQIFSAGSWDMTPWLSLGWSASMYHYAGSVLAKGVVDNHLVNPYVRFDAAPFTGLQELSLKAGALVSYQRDRVNESSPNFPSGAEFVLSARNWGFGVNNTLYVGKDLMPYYGSFDTGGNKYGPMLYRGSAFYRGTYDMVEAYWQPHISEFVDLKLSARFHFDGGGYLGCQQVCSLVLDLERVGRRQQAPKTVSQPMPRRGRGRGRSRQPIVEPGRSFAL